MTEPSDTNSKVASGTGSRLNIPGKAGTAPDGAPISPTNPPPSRCSTRSSFFSATTSARHARYRTAAHTDSPPYPVGKWWGDYSSVLTPEPSNRQSRSPGEANPQEAHRVSVARL
jgi:hypothetical protein